MKTNKSIMSKAEQVFAAGEKKTQQFLKDKESAEIKRAEKTARLKALRLQKKAAEK